MIIRKAETDKYILTIEYDEYPTNPMEWDNLGTVVCWHRRYNLGDPHCYESPRDFLKSLAQEFAYTESGQKVIKNRAEQEMENYYISFVQEEGEYIIESFGEYNYFGPDIFDSYEEAARHLKEYEQDLIDNPDWNEFTDQELWDIIYPNVVILPLYLYDHGDIIIRTSSFSDHWDSGQIGWIYAPKEVLLKETGYTEDELFSLDRNRLPKVGEHVRIKGYEDNGWCGWGKVIEINADTITVDFDWVQIPSFRKPENVITVSQELIIEVMSNQAEQLLEQEVEVYNQYLQGEVYGYVLKEKKKCDCCGNVTEAVVDSCWGFYGDDFKNNGLLSSIPEEFRFLVDKLEDV